MDTKVFNPAPDAAPELDGEIEADEAAIEEEAEIVELSRRLTREGETALEMGIDGRRSLRELKVKAGQLYLGQQYDQAATPYLHQFVVNKTQPAAISQMATQLQSPARIRFNGTESGEPAKYALSARGARKVRALMQSGMFAPSVFSEDGMLMPVQPQEILPGTVIEEELGLQLAELTENSRNPLTGSVMPGPLDDQDIFVVNDMTKAAIVQTLWDKQYELANGDFYLTLALMQCNIFGDQTLIYDWDPQLRRGTLTVPHFLAVMHDPTSTWVSDSNSEQFDQLMPADRAGAKWPKFKKLIDEAAQSGRLKRPGDMDRPDSSTYQHVDFERPMVTIRTHFLRNHPFPLGEQQAIAGGFVTAGPMTTEHALEKGHVTATKRFYPMPPEEPAVGDAGLEEGAGEEPSPEESDIPAMAADPNAPVEEYTGDTHQLEDGSHHTGMIHDDATSQPLACVEGFCDKAGNDTHPDEPTWPKRFLLAETGEETKPGAGNWPVRYHIRQLRLLVEIDKVLDDAECYYSDMPLAWLKNVHVPNSPYSLGEPVRLEDVQKYINMLSSVLFNWIMYFPYPQEYLPASLIESLREAGESTNQHPGRQIPVEDVDYEKWFSGTKSGFAQYPPPPPAELFKLLEIFLRLHDELSGNVNVRQGVSPTANASGELANTLLAESKGIAGFKAMYLEWTLKHIAKLWLEDLMNPDRFPDDEWDAYLGKYPAVLRPLLRDGARALKLDVTAEVTYGAGSTRRNNQERAQLLFQAGAIGRQDLLESQDWPDVKGALRRVKAEQDQQAPPTPGGGPSAAPAPPPNANAGPVGG